MAFAVTFTVLRTNPPPVGAVIATVGGWLSTVTETEAAAVFPAVSRATAVTVWFAEETEVVFHEIEYGGEVTGKPMFTPSTWNCTLATATLSAALAVTPTVPANNAAVAGAVNETVGG
jgi:hypothetical protein